MGQTFNREAYKNDLLTLVKESKMCVNFWEERQKLLWKLVKCMEPVYEPKIDKLIHCRTTEDKPIEVDSYLRSMLQISRNHKATARDLVECMQEIIEKDMYSFYI